MSCNFSKCFFSKKRAEAFADLLRENGAEKVELWSGLDAFKQTQYIVRWNNK